MIIFGIIFAAPGFQILEYINLFSSTLHNYEKYYLKLDTYICI